MSSLVWAQFAARVNETRMAKGLSISAVARLSGVPKATAQGWLNGRHAPTPALRRNFYAAVRALGLESEIPIGLRWAHWGVAEPRPHASVASGSGAFAEIGPLLEPDAARAC